MFVLKEGNTGEMINDTIELSALERKKFVLKINIYYIYFLYFFIIIFGSRQQLVSTASVVVIDAEDEINEPSSN